MKRLIPNIYLFLTLITFASCTKEVEVELTEGDTRLVVEASIDWERGTTGATQTIKLNQTTPYFDENRESPVSGAIVTITKDDDNQIFLFADQGDGTYITQDFVPELRQSYTLQISLDGKTYTAQETMMPVSNIIRIEQGTDEGLSSDDIEVTMHYDDPASEANFYMAEFVPSHKSLPTIWAFSDIFSNGNENIFFYEDPDFSPGDSVQATLLGISETYYNYMSVVIFQSSQNFGGPFAMVPVQPTGNCKNEADPNEEVLGYFRLCEVVRETHIIQ